MAGRMIGSTTSRTACGSVRAPSVSDASSRLRSIWLRLARPARMPTGKLRNTNAMHQDRAGAGQLHRRHVEGQDVGDADHRAGDGEAHHGQELERGLAGEVVPRTAARRSAGRSAAVSGMAISASSSVVMNELQAEPLKEPAADAVLDGRTR